MEAKNLGDFIFVYEKFAATENKSNRTIETVTAAVGDFNRFLGESADVRLVKPEDLRRYIQLLQERPKWHDHPTIKTKDDGLSPHTVASYVRSIRSFFNGKIRRGEISIPSLTSSIK